MQDLTSNLRKYRSEKYEAEVERDSRPEKNTGNLKNLTTTCFVLCALK